MELRICVVSDYESHNLTFVRVSHGWVVSIVVTQFEASQSNLSPDEVINDYARDSHRFSVVLGR